MKRFSLALFLFAACRCSTSSYVIQDATNRSVLVQAVTREAYCSGVILAQDTVLTAGHCYDDKITVDNIPATVIKRGLESGPDLLLLKVKTPKYSPLTIGDATVAETVYVVAQHSPWIDLFNTGYVARVDKDKGELFIHILAIPGYSGSGVFGSDGKLVGISTQMLSTQTDHGVVPMFSVAVSGAEIRKFLGEKA